MKSSIVVSLMLVLVAIVACGKPSLNAERSAACKSAGNSRMCGICCKTKEATFTAGTGDGTCECFGSEEK